MQAVRAEERAALPFIALQGDAGQAVVGAGPNGFCPHGECPHHIVAQSLVSSQSLQLSALYPQPVAAAYPQFSPVVNKQGSHVDILQAIGGIIVDEVLP